MFQLHSYSLLNNPVSLPPFPRVFWVFPDSPPFSFTFSFPPPLPSSIACFPLEQDMSSPDAPSPRASFEMSGQLLDCRGQSLPLLTFLARPRARPPRGLPRWGLNLVLLLTVSFPCPFWALMHLCVRHSGLCLLLRSHVPTCWGQL